MENKINISLDESNVQNAERDDDENYFGDYSSICSDEASSYPEEQDFVRNFKTTLERPRRNYHKRYRVGRKPGSWKKKVEIRFEKKMRVLQQLIPNCDNMDNGCILDETMEHIKNLQNQLQFILSANAVKSGLYISMMQALQRPNIMHQIYSSSIARNDLVSKSSNNLDGSRVQMGNSSVSPSGGLPPFPSMYNSK